MMDYFTIIKRLGLFQVPAAGMQQRVSLPPLKTHNSAKASPINKLNSPLSCSPELKKNEKKTLELKTAYTELPPKPSFSKFKNLSLKALINPSQKPEIKPQRQKRLQETLSSKNFIRKKSTDEFSRLSGWTRTSSFKS